MQISPITIALIGATAALLSCGEQPSGETDPTLGRACFEAHLETLPPGSQYEGIAKASRDLIMIQVMTGTKVEPFDCIWEPAGTVRAVRE